jgi:putative ABC transport system permease protein
VIALPYDFRSGVILRGRYLEREEPLQILVPGEVIDRLLGSIMRVARLLDAVVLVVGLAAALAVALAVFLSYQLRRGEVETVFKLGCRRATIARIIAVEVALVLGAGMVLAGLITLGLIGVVDDAAVWLLATRD